MNNRLTAETRPLLWEFVIDNDFKSQCIANWNLTRERFGLRNSERPEVYNHIRAYVTRRQNNQSLAIPPSRTGHGMGERHEIIIGPPLRAIGYVDEPKQGGEEEPNRDDEPVEIQPDGDHQVAQGSGR